MRLIKCEDDGALSLTEDLFDQDLPESYAVLSHTWGPIKQEVNLQDFESRLRERTTDKIGYKKIWFCRDQATQHRLEYFWLDTCCIDKTNSVELGEAINSMFRWYREAARCYVYLSDVTFWQLDNEGAWLLEFRNSRWFKRGWTLQELLAPKSVEFLSSDGVRLGDKSSLEAQITEITGIAVDALRGKPLSDFSVSERMSWAVNRTTSRKEDEAYSLLGIFDVYMPLIYGERERALVRLQDEIDRSMEAVRSLPYSTVSDLTNSMSAYHPVKKNYRRVHVTILYWVMDELQDCVSKIANNFRSLYHYEVREISLPYKHRIDLRWPWVDLAQLDDRDLQIMYYLGNTMPFSDTPAGTINIAARPAKQPAEMAEIYPKDPHPCACGNREHGCRWEHFPDLNWLSNMIGIPELESDVFVVLDCYIEGLEDDSRETVPFVLDDDNSWARYLLLFAGYVDPDTKPGRLSDKLMSLLEELASSNRFFAREGLIRSKMLREKLEKMVRYDDEMVLNWFGNDGRDFIHISPLQTATESRGKREGHILGGRE